MDAFVFDQVKGNEKSKGREEILPSKMPFSDKLDTRSSSLIDVEKAETESPELLESLISSGELHDREQAARSKPLIAWQKIVVTLLVVCFVVVEAYFVGISFRDWLDNQKHANSTNITMWSAAGSDGGLVVPLHLEGRGGYKAAAESDGVQEGSDGDLDPFEDFEGGLTARGTSAILDGLVERLLQPGGEKSQTPSEEALSARTVP